MVSAFSLLLHSIPYEEGGRHLVGAFVYMLRCADGSFYVGNASGNDLEKRFAEHQMGAFPGSYTYTRRPVELAWSEYFDRVIDANEAERQIKGWSRAKKEALIRGDWEGIKKLSKRRGGRPPREAGRR